MKFEFEIPDEELHRVVDDIAKRLSKDRPVFGSSLTQVIERALYKRIEGIDFDEKIKKAIEKRADVEIEAVLDKKFNGWVKRRVKEMLHGIRRFIDKEQLKD